MLNINVTGETMIFRNDKGFYSTSLSKKKLNAEKGAEYENAYITVEFRKGVEVPNRTKINIKQGWVSFNKYEKEGKTNVYFKIFVNDFDYVGGQSVSKTQTSSEFLISDDDDLPF